MRKGKRCSSIREDYRNGRADKGEDCGKEKVEVGRIRK
jgi:hypothetical protein